jgi:hypothetical protein
MYQLQVIMKSIYDIYNVLSIEYIITPVNYLSSFQLFLRLRSEFSLR